MINLTAVLLTYRLKRFKVKDQMLDRKWILRQTSSTMLHSSNYHRQHNNLLLSIFAITKIHCSYFQVLLPNQLQMRLLRRMRISIGQRLRYLINREEVAQEKNTIMIQWPSSKQRSKKIKMNNKSTYKQNRLISTWKKKQRWLKFSLSIRARTIHNQMKIDSQWDKYLIVKK